MRPAPEEDEIYERAHFAEAFHFLAVSAKEAES
jgi:hypothetical protein